MRYRSEVPYGEGYRDIIDVMTYEIYESGNIDILVTLKPIIEMHDANVSSSIDDVIASQDIKNESYIRDLCEEIVSILNNIYNKNLKYCLWLADYNVVKDYYGDGTITYEDIDAYEPSDIILSDLGHDGCLYAYEELPEPHKSNRLFV